MTPKAEGQLNLWIFLGITLGILACQPLAKADSEAEPEVGSERGDAEVCNHLVEVQGAMSLTDLDFNASDKWGMTTIHAVVILDCLHAEELLEMLMTRRDLELNPQDELGRTPLTLAIL